MDVRPAREQTSRPAAAGGKEFSASGWVNVMAPEPEEVARLPQ